MIKGKNVSIRILEYDDIETVRKWRNSPEVYKYFVFNDQITQSKQEKWYNEISLDPSCRVFIIEFKGEPIGLTDIKKIDWTNRVAETGMFLPFEEHQNSMLPYEIAFLQLDFCFNYLNLRKVTCQVLVTNKRALRFNKGLGYQVEGIQKQQVYHFNEYVDLYWLGLFKEDFLKKFDKLKKLFIDK
jgi:UDP-4-amino-4,6-dideoxy-N-acetyl-beta-L-altrosamine N-acetyltransferase